MEVTQVSSTHRICLNKPILVEYSIDPMHGDTSTYTPLFDAIEDILGVMEVDYDFSDKNAFYITVDRRYSFKDIQKYIRTLCND